MARNKAAAWAERCCPRRRSSSGGCQVEESGTVASRRSAAPTRPHGLALEVSAEKFPYVDFTCAGGQLVISGSAGERAYGIEPGGASHTDSNSMTSESVS